MQKESLNSKKEKALKISIKEGAVSSFSLNLLETYITPLALALKASALQVGFLTAISGLFSPIAQFFGSRLMIEESRKKIVMRFVLLQALLWIPIASLGIIYWFGIAQNYLVYILIAAYALASAAGGVLYPAWFSWMGDLVPEDKRGAFFSKRNRITGTVGIISVLLAGFFIDILETKGLVLLGFSILFALASASRFLAYGIFKKQYAPKFTINKGDYFSFLAFLKKADNFGKFALFQLFFNLAIMVASPFFAVYMLQELEFTKLTYVIVSLSSSLSYLLFTPFAGRFSDRFGNRKLLYLGSILFALNPLLWIVIKSPLFLILIPQVIVGLANAAFVMAFTNFTYDAVSPKHRGICIAYTNILAGIGIFAGALIGGFLIDYLPKTGLNVFFIVFLIAGILRFAVAMLFLPHIKEVKKVARIPEMHINIVHPIKTIHGEIGWFRNFFKSKT